MIVCCHGLVIWSKSMQMHVPSAQGPVSAGNSFFRIGPKRNYLENYNKTIINNFVNTTALQFCRTHVPPHIQIVETLHKIDTIDWKVCNSSNLSYS